MSKIFNDPTVFQFFTEIGIIQQLASTKLQSVLPDDLKMSHFTVLNHLTRMGKQQSPAQMASALQVTKAAITNTLQRLVKRELIEVIANPNDGRGKLVSLTDKGKLMLEQSTVSIAPLIIQLEQEFGQSSFNKAIPFLETIRKYLDEERS
ncbi:MAG: MarR family transcriptional regulator [Gammaproteobacteria bacterium]|nr:MAG: MarR family transcriptional regulator [Gammaproteobacteria bacterium]